MGHPFPSHIIALTSLLHIISMAFSIFCWKVTILSVMRFSPQSSCSKTPPPISKTMLRAASQQYEFQRADVSLGVSHKLKWQSPLQITLVIGAVTHRRRTHSIIQYPGGWGFHRAGGGKPKGASGTISLGPPLVLACVARLVKQWNPKMRLIGVMCLKIKSSLEWSRPGSVLA